MREEDLSCELDCKCWNALVFFLTREKGFTRLSHYVCVHWFVTVFLQDMIVSRCAVCVCVCMFITRHLHPRHLSAANPLLSLIEKRLWPWITYLLRSVPRAKYCMICFLRLEKNKIQCPSRKLEKQNDFFAELRKILRDTGGEMFFKSLSRQLWFVFETRLPVCTCVCLSMCVSEGWMWRS